MLLKSYRKFAAADVERAVEGISVIFELLNLAQPLMVCALQKICVANIYIIPFRVRSFVSAPPTSKTRARKLG